MDRLIEAVVVGGMRLAIYAGVAFLSLFAFVAIFGFAYIIIGAFLGTLPGLVGGFVVAGF